MPRKKASNISPEAIRIAAEINSYPRSFSDLLKHLMMKYSEKNEPFSEKAYMSDRTLKRLRSPEQRPSITDIKAILVAMKPTIIDGQQLIRSAGFDPLSTDPEIVELILCITGN